MNSKQISLKLFLLFLLAFIAVGTAAYAPEDFTATSKGSIELCPCSNQAYTVIVENTGTVPSSYKVLADGSASGWIKFNPDRFSLNPGQKGSFYVIVNSECNIKGNYDLKMFITSNWGITKAIKQNLEFSECYDYSLEQGNVIDEAAESIEFEWHDGQYSLCKDEQKVMPILITNNENFENKYRMFLDAPEWAKLNTGSASLGAKKSGIFLINLDMVGVEGDFDFKLNAISELGKVQRKKDIKVSAGECYSIGLELEKENNVVCGGEEQRYDLTIKNSGTLGHSVALEAEGVDWAGFETTVLQTKANGNKSNGSTEPKPEISEKKVLQLGPGEEKIVGLNVNPPEGLSGNFEIWVHATLEDKKDFISSEISNIDVMPKADCYKADISAKTSVTNNYNEDFFFAKVKNNGIKKADYDVSLEGVPWVSINPETLDLNPGQTGNLNLKVNPGDDVIPGTYGIKINLESNGAFYSKNVDILLKKENELMKKFKVGARFYRYYIYLLVLLAILAVLFRKEISKLRDSAKKRYKNYRIKSERIKALKLARKEREEEKRKKEELEEKEKKSGQKESKGNGKRKTNKSKISKIWVFILALIAALIFVGHKARLFNAKYLHIYIWNILVGYFYYILIGIGAVIALFLLFLFFNYVRKKGKKLKVKKSAKKADKKAKKKDKPYNSPYSRILLFIFAAILIYIAAYFNLFNGIKDFFVLYMYYIMIGIVILIVLILIIRFYKPLFKFLRE